jgi:hypothetical protein
VLHKTRGQIQIILGVVIVLFIICLAVFWPVLFPSHPPPAVEIVDLKIGTGTSSTEFKTANNTFTEITFRLKHNDGAKHTVTVIFLLSSDAARHVSIVTGIGQPLSQTQYGFEYGKVIDATDDYLPQKVQAWAHMQGLKSVSVPINVSLLVDGQPTGGTQSLTLDISA